MEPTNANGCPRFLSPIDWSMGGGMDKRVAFAALALSACAAPPTTVAPAVAPGQSPLLAGRVAGPPQHCLPLRPTDNLRIDETDRSLLVYGFGRTIWATRLPDGCAFRPGDIPVFHPTGSSNCRGDIVGSVDRLSGIPGPSCVLGDFVPYTR
jgi:hypothetical protein